MGNRSIGLHGGIGRQVRAHEQVVASVGADVGIIGDVGRG